MTAEKRKLVIETSVVLAIVAVVAIVVCWMLSDGGNTPRPQAAQVAEPAMEAWEKRFNSVYALREGEVAKRIPPPFIPERMKWFREVVPGQATNAREPSRIVFEWNGDVFWERYVSYGSPGNVASAIRSVIGFSSYEMDMSPELRNQPMTGDWVIRNESPQPQRIHAFEQEYSKLTGKTTKLTQRPMEREVIVVSGTFKFTPLSTTNPSDKDRIHVFHKEQAAQGGITEATVQQALAMLPRMVDSPVIVEANLGPEKKWSWRFHDDARRGPRGPGGPPPEQRIDEILANVAKQTDLTFQRERRVVPTWVLEQQSQ